jgi:hypothetical protein
VERGISVKVREVALRTGDQIIKSGDLVTFRQQSIAQMRANETRRPRNKMIHQDLLSFNVTF